jgi:hypothetical protein
MIREQENKAMTDRGGTTEGGHVDGPLLASCQCGQVAFEAIGAPIVSAVCYCASCQEAGRRLEELPAAPAVLRADGGTSYVLYRKDRVRCTKGAELLQEHRLKPESPTRRVRSACCNSAMFLDMTKGHWLTIYRGRFPKGAPPIQMRVMARDRPAGIELADDVPNYAGHSGKFMWRLIAARIAMGLRTPKLTY